MFRLISWLSMLGLIYFGYSLTTALNEVPRPRAAASSTVPVVDKQTPSMPEATNASPSMVPSTGSGVASTETTAKPKTFEQYCESTLGPTMVSVVIGQYEVVYDYTKRVYELTQMAENSKGLTLGLTTSRPNIGFVWDMRAMQDSASKKFCMRPKIVLSINPGDQLVYVGKEFQQGSCAFNEILGHELKHVDTNLAMAKQVAKFMEQYIRASVENRVIYGDSRQQLEQYIIEAIQDHWLPMAKLELGRTREKHREIDSPEEYMRVNNSCSQEIPEVLQRFGLKG